MWALLWIIYRTGDAFVFWACLFITVFALLMIVIAPLVIMPLFNKFDPMEDNLLRQDVERLAVSINYPISKVEVLDGSKRSGHSNAFQYGFGKIKKIVIFDTLLEQHLGVTEEAKKNAEAEKESKVGESDNYQRQVDGSDSDSEEKDGAANEEGEKKRYEQKDFKYENTKGRLEILAVVAHELGHWQHMDTIKLMISQLIKIYAVFFAFSYSLEYTAMWRDFGFAKESKFLSLILFFMLIEPIFYVLQVLNTWMTRRIEFQADEFSVEMGYGPYLHQGLISLFINNSGNLNPDWLYAALKYDHPALVERLQGIENYMLKVTKDKNPDSNPTNFSETTELYNKSFKEELEKRHPEAMGLAALGPNNEETQPENMEGGEAEPVFDSGLHLQKGEEKDALLKKD